MQRGTGSGDDFFGFGDSFPGAFSRARSLSSRFFGGRGLFDDPFFTYPFFTHPSRNIMSPSFFGSSIFDTHDNPYGEACSSGILDHQPLQQHKTTVPIIQEITDDDDAASDEHAKDHEEYPEKILRSGKESHFQDPMVESRGVKEHVNFQDDLLISSAKQPQASKYTFHSSSVTYGGINGAYFTSSRTRRMGSDGVMMEESKEADTTSGRATHRVSRGIHDKGHSLTRRLNSDGRVDSLQTLHNLNEDELPGFEVAWKENAGQTLIGCKPGIGMREHGNTWVNGNTRGSNNQGGRSSRVINIEVLPSTTDHVEIFDTALSMTCSVVCHAEMGIVSLVV